MNNNTIDPDCFLLSDYVLNPQKNKIRCAFIKLIKSSIEEEKKLEKLTNLIEHYNIEIFQDLIIESECLEFLTGEKQESILLFIIQKFYSNIIDKIKTYDFFVKLCENELFNVVEYLLSNIRGNIMKKSIKNNVLKIVFEDSYILFITSSEINKLIMRFFKDIKYTETYQSEWNSFWELKLSNDFKDKLPNKYLYLELNYENKISTNSSEELYEKIKNKNNREIYLYFKNELN